MAQVTDCEVSTFLKPW